MFVNKCRRLYELTGLPLANKAKIVLLVTKLLSYTDNHARHVILIDPTMRLIVDQTRYRPRITRKSPKAIKAVEISCLCS